LVTVTGAGPGPEVLEVELGTPVGDILARSGVEDPVAAVLIGGYGGTWLDGSRLSVPYAPGPLAEAGATMGVGVIVALPVTSCGIAETARLAREMASESAGQCGPCVFGLPDLAEDLEHLWGGRSDGDDVLLRIERHAAQIQGRGACRHPDGVVRMVRSALSVFADDAAEHAGGRPCAARSEASVLPPPRPAGPGAGTAAGRRAP
jgi:NADH:ubiquinone oxidoreductase subunit F (NADH-binding)